MSLGHLSIRPSPGNRLHNLWCNHGWYWVHYTLHFDGRKRRIRRSLDTKSLIEAIRRRDELFASIERDGELVPMGPDQRRIPQPPDDGPQRMLTFHAALQEPV